MYNCLGVKPVCLSDLMKIVISCRCDGLFCSSSRVYVQIGEDGKPRRLWSQTDYAGRCVQVRWGPYDETIISCHENGDIMVSIPLLCRQRDDAPNTDVYIYIYI